MKTPLAAPPEMLVEAQRRFDAWLAEQPVSLSSFEIALIQPAWISGFLDGQAGRNHQVAEFLDSDLERDAYTEGFRSAR